MDYKKTLSVIGGVSIIVGMLLVYRVLYTPPTIFPTGRIFTVSENESLRSISIRLSNEGYIKSSLLFRMVVSFLNKDTGVHLGGYAFETPTSLLGVVDTLTKGNKGVPLITLTVPEGSTSLEIASLVTKVLPNISVEDFMSAVHTANANGKLFPSTYYLLPSHTAGDVIERMLLVFSKKVEPVLLSQQVQKPLTSYDDIIVLASLVEGEAKTSHDMKIVAGILLKRLAIMMPLQVDVAKETYKERGLPLSPINNPGLVALQAVLDPIPTEYLYYITGNDGAMYYAKTFEEHKRNIQKYLK
ncbi:MAG: hypothetical protein RLZZ308_694 [Candidatus Parcubacteria bacterium]